MSEISYKEDVLTLKVNVAERRFVEMLGENPRERTTLGLIEPHPAPHLAEVGMLAKFTARRMRRRQLRRREIAEPTARHERVDVIQAALLMRIRANVRRRES